MKRIISSVCAFVMSVTAVDGAVMAKDDRSVMITAKYDADGVLAGVATTAIQLDLDAARAIYGLGTDSRVYLWYGETGQIINVSAELEDYRAEQDERDKQDAMLIDYYSATVATVGSDRSYEAVLYEYSDTEAKLVIYQNYPGGEEMYSDTYIVPYEAVERCYKLIEESKLAEWNAIYPDIPLTGAVTVCKFRGADGEYVRVSTDAMPDNGRGILDSIGAVMGSYVKDE